MTSDTKTTFPCAKLTLKLPSMTDHEIATYKCNSYVQPVGIEFSSLVHFHPTISNFC